MKFPHLQIGKKSIFNGASYRVVYECEQKKKMRRELNSNNEILGIKLVLHI